MTTANAQTAPTTRTEMPELAQKIRERLVSTVQKGQQRTLKVARIWAKAGSVLPVLDLPAIPGVAAIPGAHATTGYVFDVATDLLTAQRDFALQLADLLVPATLV